MPFTFAHPAVVIPLTKVLGRHDILSALVIGSISPDLEYIIPIPMVNYVSHSITGLFLFCMPMGLATYIVFHKFLKGPLLSLLPEFLFRKLGQTVREFNSLPPTSWITVFACLLLGAVTHLLWDAFTHSGAQGILMFPFLESTLFHIGTYPMYVYKLLQHGSTILGLIVIAWYIWSWFQRSEEDPISLPFTPSKMQKMVIAPAICTVPIVTGFFVGVNRIGKSDFLYEFQMLVGHAVFAALPTYAFALLLYGLWWHLQSLRGQRLTK